MTAIAASDTTKQSGVAKLGWGILLVISALHIFYISWFFSGPNIMLANIAERTSLDQSEFQQGSPSAFDVITLVARQFAIVNAALGLLALLVSWKGFRHGSRWAWRAMWVLVAALMAVAATFIMAGGVTPTALVFLSLGAVALVGQLLARRGLPS